jgi:hypothetical protein
LPIESPFVFYPRFAANLAWKHFKMAQLVWRFHGFKKRLERDPGARNYTDVALTPDCEDGADALEMLIAHPAPNAATLVRQENAGDQSLVGKP